MSTVILGRNKNVIIIPSGTRGPSGTGTHHHDQAVASDTWVIEHNLGRFPSVMIVDSAGDSVLGEIHHNSINEVELRFTAAFAGVADCS